MGDDPMIKSIKDVFQILTNMEVKWTQEQKEGLKHKIKMAQKKKHANAFTKTHYKENSKNMVGLYYNNSRRSGKFVKEIRDQKKLK